MKTKPGTQTDINEERTVDVIGTKAWAIVAIATLIVLILMILLAALASPAHAQGLSDPIPTPSVTPIYIGPMPEGPVVHCNPMYVTIGVPSIPAIPGAYGVLVDPKGKYWLLSFSSGTTAGGYLLQENYNYDQRSGAVLQLVGGHYQIFSLQGSWSNPYPSDEQLQNMLPLYFNQFDLNCNGPHRQVNLFLPLVQR